MTFTPQETGDAVISAIVVGTDLEGDTTLSVGTPNLDIGTTLYKKQEDQTSAVYEIRVECRYAASGQGAQLKPVEITTSQGEIYPRGESPTGEQSVSTQTDQYGNAYAWLRITESARVVIGATCLGTHMSRAFSLRMGALPGGIYKYQSLGGLSGSVYGMELRHDGLQLATAGDSDDHITFYDSTDWSSFSSSQPNASRGHRVHYCSNGRLYTISESKYLYVFDSNSGTRLAKHDLSSAGTDQEDMDISPDCSYAVISNGPDINVWSTASGTRYSGPKTFTDDVTAVAWSTHGSYIAAADQDGNLRLYSAPSLNTQYWSINIPSPYADDSIYSIDFSPDDSHIVVSNIDGKVVVIRRSDGTERDSALHIESGSDRKVYGVKWSTDGSQILSGGADGRVRVWDWTGSSLSLSASSDEIGTVRSVDWRKVNGKLLIAAGHSSAVAILGDVMPELSVSASVDPLTPVFNDIVEVSATVTGGGSMITDAVVVGHLSFPSGAEKHITMAYSDGQYTGTFQASEVGTYHGSVEAMRTGFVNGSDPLPDVTVDNVPPDTEITSASPAEGECVGKTSLYWVWRGIDETTPLADLNYAWRLDDGTYSPFNPDTSTIVTGLSEGAHVFSVKCHDGELEDATPAERSFVVDSIGPDIIIMTNGGNGPGVDFETDQSSVIISGSCTDPAPSCGIISVSVSTGETNEGTLTDWQFSVDLTEGYNLITVKAEDNAGNIARDTIAVVYPRADLSPDLDGSGIVNLADFGELALRWMDHSCFLLGWCEGCDLDRSGAVDIVDLGEMSLHWLEVSEPCTVSDMVLVPAGSFFYQDDPCQQVYLDDFWIGKYEVTNEEYCQFLNATEDPRDPCHYDARMEISTDGISWTVTLGRDQYPIRYVNYSDAVAFAAWRSVRDGIAYSLPTEQQWEKAAAWNPDLQRHYLYAFQQDTFGCVWANGSGCVGDTTEVGHYDGSDNAEDAYSYYDCYDMSGNVNEWTLGTLDGYRVLRGGAYYDPVEHCTTTIRHAAVSTNRSPGTGFRLAR